MTEFRRVTPDFSVAPQLAPEDFARAAAEGFKTIIINRPDHEEPNQIDTDAAEALAKAAGLKFVRLPFQGRPSPAIVAETAAAIGDAGGPVLAYCRSGTRSVTAWALAEALGGEKSPDEIIALAGGAGYDLSGARAALEQLAPR